MIDPGNARCATPTVLGFVDRRSAPPLMGMVDKLGVAAGSMRVISFGAVP